MGDYADFAVTAAVFDNEPLDLPRYGFAFVVCIVRRVERNKLGRIVEFIGKLRAAEGSLFEKAELSVLEADGFIKSDGSEDFYALLLCETLQSAVCLRGCGKYSVLRLRERVSSDSGSGSSAREITRSSQLSIRCSTSFICCAVKPLKASINTV